MCLVHSTQIWKLTTTYNSSSGGTDGSGFCGHLYSHARACACAHTHTSAGTALNRSHCHPCQLWGGGQAPGTSLGMLLPNRCTCLPPYTSVAPSFTPVSQYCSSFSRWALWFWGPWSVDLSSGSPIFIILISSTCILPSPQNTKTVSSNSGSPS